MLCYEAIAAVLIGGGRGGFFLPTSSYDRLLVGALALNAS